MSDLSIITNNHPRDILYWYELSDKERAEFNYLDTPESQDESEFFRYKGHVYSLDEFMRSDMFPGWDGYSSDSFFSGVLVRYPREEWGDLDTEHIIVGWYCS